jgi:hypothetical protein
MSNLERRAKPLIEPMVRGQNKTLDPPEQLEVATWASKTVLALEYREPGTVVARPEDRRLIMNQLHPPPHHCVRLAYRDAVGESLVAKMFVARTDDSESDRPDVFAVLLGIGFLLVQVWGGHGHPGAGVTKLGYQTDRTAMVWPPIPRGVQWPPKVAVPEEDFDELAREVIAWADDSPEMAEWRRRRTGG